jgi:hypothetical protein
VKLDDKAEANDDDADDRVENKVDKAEAEAVDDKAEKEISELKNAEAKAKPTGTGETAHAAEEQKTATSYDTEMVQVGKAKPTGTGKTAPGAEEQKAATADEAEAVQVKKKKAKSTGTRETAPAAEEHTSDTVAATATGPDDAKVADEATSDKVDEPVEVKASMSTAS